jgi:hypothetical protein
MRSKLIAWHLSLFTRAAYDLKPYSVFRAEGLISVFTFTARILELV